MKCLYVTIEIILSGALMYYGETIGTNNMWYVLIGIIVSHFIMNLLYNIRSFEEGTKNTNKHKSTKTKPTSKPHKTEKEPELTDDDFFNLDTISNADESFERIFYNQDTN